MAQNVTLTFNDPILYAGEYFVISYQEINDPNLTTLSNKYDNDDVTLPLLPGTYKFYIHVVKADGTHCPETVITYIVYPEPVTPPIDNPVDPPITSVTPCNCVAVTEAIVREQCDGGNFLKLTMNYPATNKPCQVKVWVRYSGNGNQTSYTYNNSPAEINIALSSTSYVEYKIEMYCCSDNNETLCVDWDVVGERDICTCSAPTITMVSNTALTGSSTTLVVNIVPSTPSFPPYTVTVQDGNSVYIVSLNSSGQHTLIVPFAYTSANLKVENQCGSSNINITQTRCKTSPDIYQAFADTVDNSVTVKWWGEGNSNYTIELYAYGQVSPSHTANVAPIGSPATLQVYTFTGLYPPLAAGNLEIRVIDICGIGQRFIFGEDSGDGDDELYFQEWYVDDGYVD